MITPWVRSQWGNEMVDRIRSRGWPEFLHPEDVQPWVHTENLAEMAWLCLSHPTAPNEPLIAVDRNVSIMDFYGPVASALGQPVVVPDRAPSVSIAHLGKFHEALGYRARFTFEETVSRLGELAGAPGG